MLSAAVAVITFSHSRRSWQTLQIHKHHWQLLSINADYTYYKDSFFIHNLTT